MYGEQAPSLLALSQHPALLTARRCSGVPRMSVLHTQPNKYSVLVSLRVVQSSTALCALFFLFLTVFTW